MSNCKNIGERGDSEHLNTNTKHFDAIIVYELRDVFFFIIVGALEI